MLEPRRLAARSAARYMAATLGEQVGETVGYRVKMDTRVSPRTRIEVITEGVLTRLLQDDPTLGDAGIVIFDEFHERSIHADLGLALCLQSQAILREDLRILVMSATLETGPVASLLGGAPIVSSEGRAFPIETYYVNRRSEERIESAVVRTIVNALDHHSEGDLLVFLPGTGEIRRVEARLEEMRLGGSVQIAALYGSLSQEAQDKAIAPCAPGVRKVVLATSIAETSLTVEGVRVVIDSGLMRVPRFSPRSGMTRLETVAVSRASADQRRGRAGRLGPGICYRLWSEAEDRRLAERSTPELLEADLAPLALDLAAWGVSDPAELQWLDAPPSAAYFQARELLNQLGALDDRGRITDHGRQMADLGLHPRLAHMILRAIPVGYGEIACELAALLGERDIFRGEHAGHQSAPDADLRLRVEALHAVMETGGSASGAAWAAGYTVDATACRRVWNEAQQWKRTLSIPRGGERDWDACGVLLAFAYPERVAQRRENGRYLLRSGRGALLTAGQALASESYLAAAELDDHGAESRIYLAASIQPDELNRHFAEQIETETLLEWDRAAQSVRARKRERLGAIVLKETPISSPDPEAMAEAVLEGIRQEGLEILPWNKSARQLQQRLGFMHRLEKAGCWPDVSDPALQATLPEWLGPHLYGMKSRADLQRMSLTAILESLLTWEQQQQLDANAPTHIVVPSGSRVPIDYSDPEAPTLAVRLQEMFGLEETPRIGGNRVPLTINLLSPAHRPVQVTRDLASFWRNAYFEVKKDLKGRYPKHYWPDDPLHSAPTNRAKPRSQT